MAARLGAIDPSPLLHALKYNLEGVGGRQSTGLRRPNRGQRGTPHTEDPMTEATAVDSTPATQADVAALRTDVDALRVDVDRQFVELATDINALFQQAEARDTETRRAIGTRLDETYRAFDARLDETRRAIDH